MEEITGIFGTLCGMVLIVITSLWAGVVLTFRPAKAREILSRMLHSKMFFTIHQRNPFRRYLDSDSGIFATILLMNGIMLLAWGLLFLALLVRLLWIVLQ